MVSTGAIDSYRYVPAEPPDMADDHHDDRPDYDPTHVDLPERAPPLRSTAPQSDFTMGQVSKGGAVAFIGLVLTFGIALALV
jgi:hypothetical protein